MNSVAVRGAHQGLIHGLALQYPAYSPALRLSLRWLHRHRLSHQIPLPAVELMVAHGFVHPSALALALPPASGTAGFHRFLLLLSSSDFTAGPVVVDPHGDLTPTDRREVRSAYELGQTNSGAPNANGGGSILTGRTDEEAEQSAGRPVVGGKGRASPLWVVAPYDRVHGWYSSWGRTLPAADAIPTPGPDGEGEGRSVEGRSVATTTGRAYGSGSISGPEKAIVQRIQALAAASLERVVSWVGAGGEGMASANEASAALAAAEGSAELPGWEAVFTPLSPSSALGAHLVLHVSTPLVTKVRLCVRVCVSLRVRACVCVRVFSIYVTEWDKQTEPLPLPPPPPLPLPPPPLPHRTLKVSPLKTNLAHPCLNRPIAKSRRVPERSTLTRSSWRRAVVRHCCKRGATPTSTATARPGGRRVRVPRRTMGRWLWASSR